MGQERSECRRCRNRHCRQQKQTASKGHCKLFSVCQKKLRSKNGMTLTELLAAIVILGTIGTVDKQPKMEGKSLVMFLAPKN